MVCDIFNKNFEDIERGGYWIEVKGCYIHFKTKKTPDSETKKQLFRWSFTPSECARGCEGPAAPGHRT